VPEIITLVEDYDINANKHVDRARPISLYLATLFNRPEEVVPLLAEASADAIVEKGMALVAYSSSFVERYVQKYEPLWISIGNHSVPFFNATIPEISLRSEIGSRLYGMHHCAVGLFGIQGDTVTLSFRSKDEHSPNALELAQHFGGGGHKGSAGASVTRDQFIAMLT
jgi:hypothetical protein